MGRLASNAVPRHRVHRSSGRGVVTLSGRDFYTGPAGSEEAEKRYLELVSRWLAGGRKLPREVAARQATVAEIADDYLEYARTYYVKNGEITKEISLLKSIHRDLTTMWGSKAAKEFSIDDLKLLRKSWVAKGWTRSTINRYVGRVKRMFAWAAEEKLVPASVYHELAVLKGLPQNRCEAKDNPPVGPADDAAVDAVIGAVKSDLADMIRLQRLTGMRPGEVCKLRPRDVDRSEDVWVYSPPDHKTAHYGKDRKILLGPKAQAILGPYLDRMAFRPGDYVFRRNGHSYSQAILYACDKLGIDRWHPNQLRHGAATAIRRAFGIEAAQVVLGHSKLSMTEVYAEKPMELAKMVAREVG